MRFLFLFIKLFKVTSRWMKIQLKIARKWERQSHGTSKGARKTECGLSLIAKLLETNFCEVVREGALIELEYSFDIYTLAYTNRALKYIHVYIYILVGSIVTGNSVLQGLEKASELEATHPAKARHRLRRRCS